MSKLLDPKVGKRYPFTYTNHAATNVAKTFARERKRLALERATQEAAEAEVLVKVRRIKEKL